MTVSEAQASAVRRNRRRRRRPRYGSCLGTPEQECGCDCHGKIVKNNTTACGCDRPGMPCTPGRKA